MQSLSTSIKIDPETAARASQEFMHKWQETVADAADSWRQVVSARQPMAAWSAQIQFGMRSIQRWSAWSVAPALCAGATVVQDEVPRQSAAEEAPPEIVAESSPQAVEDTLPEFTAEAPSQAAEDMPQEAVVEAASLVEEEILPEVAAEAPSEVAENISTEVAAEARPEAVEDIPPAGMAKAEPVGEAEEPEATSAAPVQDEVTPEPAAAETPDDLKRIRGIGPAIERKLNGQGITTFGQIAELSEADIGELEIVLGFPGRIERDEWISQAEKLANRSAAS